MTEIGPQAANEAVLVSAYGSFIVVQQAAQHMIERGSGTIALTGASARIKGYSNSSCFAMGKFGRRSLAQPSARELAPRGVHATHFVFAEGIRAADAEPGNDEHLDPNAIAQLFATASATSTRVGLGS